MAGLIRGTFNNIYDELPEKAEYYHWVKLSDMMNWGKQDFDNSLRTTAVSKIEIPTKWPLVKIGEIISENIKSNIQVNSAKNNLSGKYPFYTSGLNIYRYDTALVSGKNIYIATGGNAIVQYYDGEAAYSTDTWVIKSKDDTKLLTPVLYYILNSKINEINTSYFKGIGLKHLQNC